MALARTAKQKVEDVLVANKVLDQATLDKLVEQAKTEDKPLLGLLVDSGKVSNEDLTKALAQINRVPYVNLVNSKIDPKILALLPPDIAERYMAVPLGEMEHRLVVAMLDAGNVQAVDFLSNRVGRPLKVYSASEEGIRQVLHQYQVTLSAQVTDDIKKLSADMPGEGEPAADQDKKGQETTKNNTTTIETIVQDSPISKALNTILEYAAKNRASDVHIEPLKDGLKIRCRVDGILREIMKLPKSTEPPLISRIKILSNLQY